MNYSSTHNLVQELLADLQSPDLLSQLFILVLCSALGWIVTRSWSKRFALVSEKPDGFPISADSFRNVLTPLLIVILVELSVLVINRWHHVGLLRVAVPLLLSLSLIRAVFFLLRKAFVKPGGEILIF